MLPSIKITLLNGQAGGTPQTEDGVAALLMCLPAPTGLGDGEAKAIFSLEEAEGLGVVAGSEAWKQISQFYSEAGKGAELWLVFTEDGMYDVLDGFLEGLIIKAKGRVRLVGVLGKYNSNANHVNGVPEEVGLSVPCAQKLAEKFSDKYAPFRVVLSANNFNGNPSNLLDYSQATYNRVAIMLASSEANGAASVGMVIGRLAAEPVQRRLSRVKSGPVPGITKAYMTDGTDVMDHEAAWEAIANKGYIFFREHIRKVGLYFSFDPTLTSPMDDYYTFARGRVIDKAMVLIYDVLLNQLSDDFQLDADGTFPKALVNNWELEIERVLGESMVNEGNISSADVSITSTAEQAIRDGRFAVRVRLLPVGHSDKIDVTLGYAVSVTQTT